jgi:hypothetical protein
MIFYPWPHQLSYLVGLFSVLCIPDFRFFADIPSNYFLSEIKLDA